MQGVKGTYIRCLRDDAGKARASVTELAKRTKTIGALAALEQNHQLRTRLQKADQEMGEKPPSRAAVAITVAPGSARSCREVLAAARAKIPLYEIGVSNAKIRQTMAGGILVEIPGQESAAKADYLAAKLKKVFPDEGDVRISRPVKRAEIRICGLDESIHPGEIKDTIAAKGGCDSEDIKVGEIKRRSPRGMGAAHGYSALLRRPKPWWTKVRSSLDGLQLGLKP